jgi:hypothetical protein
VADSSDLNGNLVKDLSNGLKAPAVVSVDATGNAQSGSANFGAAVTAAGAPGAGGSGNLGWLSALWLAITGRFAAAVALADNLANPTTTQVGANALAWNGTTWERVKSFGGAIYVIQEALRGTPILATNTTAITGTTRTQIPYVSGREPDVGSAEVAYITSIVVTNMGDTDAALTLHDGDTATVIGRVPAPSGAASGKVRGGSYSFPDPIPLGNTGGTAPLALYVTASAAVAGGIYVTAIGFEGQPAPA